MNTNFPYTISGTIIAGTRQATDLGYPTANLDVQPDILLTHGVYAGFASCDPLFTNSPCVIFYGKPYSLGDDAGVRFEIHVINAVLPDLYGKKMTAELTSFIRPNKKFNHISELRCAIQHDIASYVAN
ncbi:riboflavin kinase [Candidatus Uhrbacteria bacterium]|nr:riboflavin kinase [Candidatus Uhrbacteria bacterium]